MARPAGRPLLAALDVPVLDAVDGDDHVVAAAAVEAVDAGLAEQDVGAGVADQDVVVEGALDVLVGAGEADFVAVLDRVDPGPAGGERDVEGAGVGLGLGEGGVVLAGAADQGATGATAARRQQVAAASAVEVGRPGQATDQAVVAGAAVDAVSSRGRTRSGLPRGRRGSCRCLRRRRGGRSRRRRRLPSTRRRSLPGPRSAISQRAGPSIAQVTCSGCPAGGRSLRRRRAPFGGADAEGLLASS